VVSGFNRMATQAAVQKKTPPNIAGGALRAWRVPLGSGPSPSRAECRLPAAMMAVVVMHVMEAQNHVSD